MAAPAENLLSAWYGTGTKENTFAKQREQNVKRSRAMQLQQRLQELKDRERQAQRHNKQLLQQFEKAQDTLKEMLARNAAMKTIRVQITHKNRLENVYEMEYERYLEENSPRWQQQLQEKTQAAQKKRMGDCLRSYLEKTDEKDVLTSTVDGPLLSQGPQKCVAPQENSDYNQSSSSHHPFTHTGRFPGFLTAPHQSHSPFIFPLPSPLHPHSFLLQHLTSSPGQCQPWSGQDAAGWDSSQHNDPRPWTASGSLGQLHTALRVSQAVGEENETSRSPNSNMKDGGSGGCLSPDLDVKPVRLFSSQAESSESGRDSSLACIEKRKKRGSTQHSSSSSERSDSQKSSRTSSQIVVASFTPAQRNSSEENSTRRTKRGGGGFSVGTSQPEEGATGETRRKESKESQNTDEKEGSQSHGDKSKSCGAEEQGKNIKTQTRAEEETDVQEESSSEQSCSEEKDEEDILATGDEGETSQRSEKQISDLEEDNDSSRKETSEEEEEDQGDEEQVNNLKNKDTEIRKEDSASSQDEDESEGSEDKTNEEEEGSNKEEDGSEKEEESGDSEDIIVSPQEKRNKPMLVIPEEAAEDDDESQTQSSNEVSDDEEDIENLLAPLEQRKKEQMDVKADGEPKAVCQNMNMVQVTEVKSKTNHQSDSDEFDDFYD